jgi:hypothetical protein
MRIVVVGLVEVAVQDQVKRNDQIVQAPREQLYDRESLVTRSLTDTEQQLGKRLCGVNKQIAELAVVAPPDRAVAVELGEQLLDFSRF